MKKTNLLLATLAIPMFASCGAKSNTKKPHNLVNLDDFTNKVIEEVQNNELFGMKENQDAFSFELKLQEKSNIDFKFLKQGKKLYTEKEKFLTKAVIKFDRKKHILYAEESESMKECAAEGKTNNKESNSYIVESLNDSEFVTISPETYSYNKIKMEDCDKAVDESALETMGMGLSLFETALSFSNDAKYYVDKKVYTVVIEKNKTDNGDSVVGKTVFQLSIKKNSYSFVKTEETKEINGERKKTVKSYATLTFAKKHVSLKHTKLNKYVEQDLSFF